MNAATFDTHAAVKTLREAGADEAMAEAIVNTASAAAGADREQLAPEGRQVRRSRFRHSGYLLPKGSGVHEIGSTPLALGGNGFREPAVMVA